MPHDLLAHAIPNSNRLWAFPVSSAGCLRNLSGMCCGVFHGAFVHRVWLSESRSSFIKHASTIFPSTLPLVALNACPMKNLDRFVLPAL